MTSYLNAALDSRTGITLNRNARSTLGRAQKGTQRVHAC